MASILARFCGSEDRLLLEDMRVVRTPVQAPQANGIAERLVRTVRSECLDWLLILNAQHLARMLKVFVDHYNRCRLHRSLSLVPPNGPPSVKTETISQPIKVRRRDRLGGLLHEYEHASVSEIGLAHPTGLESVDSLGSGDTSIAPSNVWAGAPER
jgi:hypothetical protein